ncbi:MAG: divergent polysaccharide deacetylase family protein, partial [Spirochaetales bacterium]|nr:divergent polysaccharide deacetylase family protein [Spirochaetales bacterium]
GLSRGKIALILDDAGYQNDLLKSFTAFAGKLTIAVLPALPGSAEAARIIAAAGKETMLHLPMQPRREENPGPQAILTSMDDQTVIRLTKQHIDSLPGLKGVNNHMGSLVTEDPRIMSLVLGVIRERGLFFIDSRTTASSEGPRLATRMGIPCRERSVFLDNVQDRQSIRGYFETGKRIAAKQGWALMIGHVWCAELAEILPRLYEEAQAQGYEFLFVSELLGKSVK